MDLIISVCEVLLSSGCCCGGSNTLDGPGCFPSCTIVRGFDRWFVNDDLELHSRTIVVCYHCTMLLVYEVVEEEDTLVGVVRE